MGPAMTRKKAWGLSISHDGSLLASLGERKAWLWDTRGGKLVHGGDGKPMMTWRTTARLHDLRHTYASILASEGLSLPIIGALLGHTQPQTTARYAHLASDPLKAAAATIADSIAASVNGATDRKVRR